MAALDKMTILPTPSLANILKAKYAVGALIVANIVYQILVSLFAMDFLVETAQKQINNPTAAEDVRFMLLVFLGFSLFLDLIGFVGVVAENYCITLFYSVICALGGLFAIASILNGQTIVILDFVIYSVVSLASLYYATLLRNSRSVNIESLP
ncbi:hypothetical protein HDE_02998 [Halotydeus destructor]|nr:hypothetical protein HDE_02998 [Halotydeus destructor]